MTLLPVTVPVSGFAVPPFPEMLPEEPLREIYSMDIQPPEVRALLLDFQRRFAGQDGGAVLDGRDSGTVVCPDADVKLYVTASPEERARRRHRELGEAGEPADFPAVLADIQRRDERDESRPNAPLRMAPDAVLLDTTELDADAAFETARLILEKQVRP